LEERTTIGTSTTHEHFGSAVATGGDYLLIAAPHLEETGAAFLYDTATRSMLVRLVASSPQAIAELGGSVALRGETIVVAEPRRDVAPCVDARSASLYQLVILSDGFESGDLDAWSAWSGPIAR
jgi:hypothetical protein